MLSLFPILLERALSPLAGTRIPLAAPVPLDLDSDVSMCEVKIKLHRISPKTHHVTEEPSTEEDSAQPPMEIAETLSAVVENKGSQALQQQHDSIAVDDGVASEGHGRTNETTDLETSASELVDQEQPQSQPDPEALEPTSAVNWQSESMTSLLSGFDRVRDEWYQSMDNPLLSAMDTMEREMLSFSMPSMGDDIEVSTPSTPKQTTTQPITDAEPINSIGSVAEPAIVAAAVPEAVINNEETASTDVISSNVFTSPDKTMSLAVESTVKGNSSDNSIKRRNQFILKVISTFLDRQRGSASV